MALKLTGRDLRVLGDAALSHVLSRDQLLNLGYFTSVSRCNRTMRRLHEAGLVRVLKTPFFMQNLYSVRTEASDLLDARIAALVKGRSSSPRFLQHALMVTEARIRLIEKGATGWRFEAQVRDSFTLHGARHDVKPDGMVWIDGRPVLLEVDLGHVASGKFKRKVDTYKSYERSGAFAGAYGSPKLSVVTLTTGQTRKRRLANLAGLSDIFEFFTFEEFGMRLIGAWS
ncbi:MAG: replication-relaxation family protein [Armatimonadetes bacterium]|nr:replication-relaxation family protein [Armatimonadota bacterium]